jgi:predicted esterase
LAEKYPLKDVAVFIAHGTRDQLVPVERARLGVEVLQQAGAIVSYCEHEAGHKLNADCFRSLQLFFQQN